jgi:predicted lipase
MKIREGFTLRTIGNDHVVVPEGLEVINFNKIITVNASAMYLWNELQGKSFDIEEAAQLLLAKYEVDHDTAFADAKALLEQWTKAGIVVTE